MSASMAQIVVMHPSVVLPTLTRRRLEKAGFVVVVSDNPDAVRVITAEVMLSGARLDAVTRAALNAVVAYANPGISRVVGEAVLTELAKGGAA